MESIFVEAAPGPRTPLMAVTWSRWARWTHRGLYAVADRGFISGANFVVHILLARAVSPGEYGVYTLALSVFSLFGALTQALIAEPMSVFGVVTTGAERRGYLGAVITMHAGVSAAVFLLLALAAAATWAFWGQDWIPETLLSLSVTAPCVLLLALLRGAFYLDLRPGPAAALAAVYGLLTVGGLFALSYIGIASAWGALLVMGFSAVVPSMLSLRRLQPRFPLGRNAGVLGTVWRRHWGYGRWALGTALLSWIPGNVAYLVVGLFGGLAQIGSLRAVMNVMLPVAYAVQALTGLVRPYAAISAHRRGPGAARESATRASAIFIAATLVYCSLALLFREPIFQHLYGGKYSEHVDLLPWVAVFTVLWSAAHGPGTGLRAINAPASVFTAYLIAGAIAVAVGVPAVWAFGLRGAIGSGILAALAAWVAGSLLLYRKVNRNGPLATES